MVELSQDLIQRLRQVIPEGHTPEFGFCFRDALVEAGYDVDLPPWIPAEDIPIVCNELGLSHFTGEGTDVPLGKREPCIIGHIVQRGKNGELLMGHWSYFQNAEDVPQSIRQKGIFSIITLPK